MRKLKETLKEKVRKIKAPSLKERVEKVVGFVSDWENLPVNKHNPRHRIIFRIADTITLQKITQLSEELNTDAINFNFGYSGEPGYSSYTPGVEGHPGYIEIFDPK